MALFALDMGDEADAAGIVFVGGRIKTVFLQMFDFGSRCHGALLSFRRESEDIALHKQCQVF